MNIWHYIHPHYRYDIQEMKINLPKELPFSGNYSVIFFSHSKSKEVLRQFISVILTSCPSHGRKMSPLK